MKGERHRLSPEPQVNFHKLFVRNPKPFYTQRRDMVGLYLPHPPQKKKKSTPYIKETNDVTTGDFLKK
jgi:hypothetical protein